MPAKNPRPKTHLKSPPTNNGDDVKTKHEYESSDEEDLSTDLLSKVVKNYAISSRETIESLENAFTSGAVCLICISKVKRKEKIWSCTSCFCFFHLACIQRWANDSLAQKRIAREQGEDGGYYNNLGQYVPKKREPIVWDCPKCRRSYEPDEIPRHYTCFCGKEFDPADHDWLLPHSCGEICMKRFDCGHSCLLLCHPGACPPCPATLTTSCECRKSQPKLIRCFERSWSCKKPCDRILACNHRCSGGCHAECPPCMKRSKQKCLCGAKTKERNCFEARFQCEKRCGRPLSCGNHRCERVCHEGMCGECPLAAERTCFCGKQRMFGPCSEETISCGDTCEKELACGQHRCIARCHAGECSECVERVEKSCRCGAFSKEVPCSKPYFCETKCKRMRSCKIHACNRKCCDGNCPPCDKICQKTLSCSRHKCQSLCHRGLCYPCPEQGEVKCRCGHTTKMVACGREKRTKPPKCREPCPMKSKCRHEQKHSCHFGVCPPCVQVCGERLSCDHFCAARCHDYVKVKIKDKNFKPATPWEAAVERVEYKQLEHPPCEEKVPVTCLGGHETSLWPCWNSKPTSCGRLCSRQLRCSNHKCELPCHLVANQVSMEEDPASCRPCNEGCVVPRPAGCVHAHRAPCHPPPCPPCNVPIRTPCFCGLVQVLFKCSEFYSTNVDVEERQMKLRSCGSRCAKLYACGHRCVATCHPGECPNADECRKKSKILCKCGHRKAEVSCEKLRTGFALSCDAGCEEKRKAAHEAAKERERQKNEAEEERNRREMEQFEQKFGKKERKERKRRVIEEEKKTNWLLMVGLPVAIVLFAILIYVVVLE